WIMWAFSGLVQALGVIQEGMQTITQPIRLTDAAGAKPLDYRKGLIELKDLRHHYGRPHDENGAGGIRGIDLTIHPGEKIGVVGRSGAGKSSLVKLILRFYDPEGGQVLIGGQDVTKVTQDSLRRL